MTMSDAMMTGKALPAQRASRDARVKDDGSAAGVAGGDDGSFGDVMSGLAERTDAKRKGASDAGAEGDAARLVAHARSAAEGDAHGDPLDGDALASASTGAPDAVMSGLQPGSVLAQAALALVSVSTNTSPAAGGGQADLALLVAAAASGEAMAPSAAPVSGETASMKPGAKAPGLLEAPIEALAALSDGVEEVQLGSLVPSAGGDGSKTAAQGFPAFQVTVLGEETHLAPVQSVAATLNKVLGGHAMQPNGAPGADMPDSVVAADGEAGTGKGTQTVSFAMTETSVGTTAAGSQSRGGEMGRGAERQADGQAAPAPGDQQGARGVPLAGADFIAASSSDGTTGPQGLSGPSAQIARRIAAELAGGASAAGTAMQSTDGAVRVLHLRLEPANLGSVTVRISLKDNVVNLHVEASHRETAVAIERDREALSSALKSAGYVVDGITSQTADVSRTSLQTQQVAADSQLSSSLQSRTDSQSGDAQSNRRQPGGEGHPSDGTHRQGGGVNDAPGRGARAPGGALYV